MLCLKNYHKNIMLITQRQKKHFISEHFLKNYSQKKINLLLHNYFPVPKKPFIINLASTNNAINEIVFAAKTYKKSLGIMVNNKQELETYSKLGFNMIAVGTEMNILSRSISQILK